MAGGGQPAVRRCPQPRLSSHPALQRCAPRPLTQAGDGTSHRLQHAVMSNLSTVGVHVDLVRELEQLGGMHVLAMYRSSQVSADPLAAHAEADLLGFAAYEIGTMESLGSSDAWRTSTSCRWWARSNVVAMAPSLWSASVSSARPAGMWQRQW